MIEMTPEALTAAGTKTVATMRKGDDALLGGNPDRLGGGDGVTLGPLKHRG